MRISAKRHRSRKCPCHKDSLGLMTREMREVHYISNIPRSALRGIELLSCVVRRYRLRRPTQATLREPNCCQYRKPRLVWYASVDSALRKRGMFYFGFSANATKPLPEILSWTTSKRSPRALQSRSAVICATLPKRAS